MALMKLSWWNFSMPQAEHKDGKSHVGHFKEQKRTVLLQHAIEYSQADHRSCHVQHICSHSQDMLHDALHHDSLCTFCHEFQYDNICDHLCHC